VYGVLPSSIIFLVLYAWGTQRFSRERLFNIILGFFITFYAGFGLLYPSHEALHLNGMGDALVQVRSSGRRLPVRAAGYASETASVMRIGSSGSECTSAVSSMATLAVRREGAPCSRSLAPEAAPGSV